MRIRPARPTRPDRPQATIGFAQEKAPAHPRRRVRRPAIHPRLATQPATEGHWRRDARAFSSYRLPAWLVVVSTSSRLILAADFVCAYSPPFGFIRRAQNAQFYCVGWIGSN